MRKRRSRRSFDESNRRSRRTTQARAPGSYMRPSARLRNPQSATQFAIFVFSSRRRRSRPQHDSRTRPKATAGCMCTHYIAEQFAEQLPKRSRRLSLQQWRPGQSCMVVAPPYASPHTHVAYKHLASATKRSRAPGGSRRSRRTPRRQKQETAEGVDAVDAHSGAARGQGPAKLTYSAQRHAMQTSLPSCPLQATLGVRSRK